MLLGLEMGTARGWGWDDGWGMSSEMGLRWVCELGYNVRWGGVTLRWGPFLALVRLSCSSGRKGGRWEHESMRWVTAAPPLDGLYAQRRWCAVHALPS